MTPPLFRGKVLFSKQLIWEYLGTLSKKECQKKIKEQLSIQQRTSNFLRAFLHK